MREQIAALERQSPKIGVTKADAETIGAEFWTTITQPKGPPFVVPVVRVPGSQDTRGDGNIAYRVERTDKSTQQGPPIFKSVEDLFFTRVEAEAPGRRQSRTTGRRVVR